MELCLYILTLQYLISGFHTMGGEHAMEHFDVCIGPNLTCMNDLLNRMGQFDHVEYKGEQVKASPFHYVEYKGENVKAGQLNVITFNKLEKSKCQET